MITINTPINILHVTFDMRIGGTEQVIKSLVETTDKDMINMSILCLESPVGPFGKLLQESGFTVTPLSRKPGFDTSLIKKIRKHITENNIHIIHCHQYTPWVYGSLAAIGTGIKVIFTEHGRFYPDSTTWKRRVINPLLMLGTQAVTSISKATRDALIEFEFIPSRRIRVIYNGIAGLKSSNESIQIRAQIMDNKNTLLLGTVARLDPIKNHTMMLEAFKRVIDTGCSVKLIIVGDGEERGNIEARIEQLELSKHVILTGYITTPQAYIDAMDIFLLSSLSEGTSMTLLEAMSLSKPCVVTNAGGNPEIINNGDNGLVVENGNAEAFSSAIIKLCQNRSLRIDMGENGKKRFTLYFSTENMSNKFKDLYLSILGIADKKTQKIR